MKFMGPLAFLAATLALTTTSACSREVYFRTQPFTVDPIAPGSGWAGMRVRVVDARAIKDTDSLALTTATQRALSLALGTPRADDARELIVTIEHDVRREGQYMWVATTTLDATVMRNRERTDLRWHVREKSIRWNYLGR